MKRLGLIGLLLAAIALELVTGEGFSLPSALILWKLRIPRMLTALLAAWDAGGKLPENTGVLGWNGDGCTAENLAYWRDYVGNGRTAGRGGLFVATLPTIPYCEAAIALNCRGGVAYLRTPEDTSHLRSILDAAPPGAYLCGEIARDTVCILLADSRENDGESPRCRTLAELFARLEGGR